MIFWNPVKSSNVEALSHHGGTLHVKFKGGAVYAYENVSHDLFQVVLGAESVGKAFNANIKHLPFTRVVEDTGGSELPASEYSNHSSVG